MAHDDSTLQSRIPAWPFADWIRRAERRSGLVVFALLAFAIGIAYYPALTSYFISDDFSQISFLTANARHILDGQMWKEWFIGVLDGYVYFRPAAYLITFVDFLAWDQFAPGYHLTRVILHLLASFVVYLTGWQLSRERRTGVVAAILFAVLPVHAGAVSWMAATTDVVCGLAFLTGLLFYILYRQRGGPWLYGVAFAAFVVALSAKEVGIVFPVGILVYDILFHWRKRPNVGEWVARHAPFWAVLGIYVLVRMFYLSSFGYRGTQLALVP